MDDLLTTRQVAETLRVSESSVKRWCDQGLIPTIRTVGGHRRVERGSLSAFLAASNGNLPANESRSDEAEVAAGNDAFELRSQFQQALVSGEERRARQLLARWRGQMKSLAELGDELIASTFEEIGQLWECGRVEVFEERRSCQMCSQLLMELRGVAKEPPPGAPRAIGGALEGDHYTLATQLVELVLREAGWDAVNLGGNIPFASLKKAIRQEQPRLLWLSISSIPDAEQFEAQFRSFSEDLPDDLLIVVGGRAVTPELRKKMKCTMHCDNLQQLASFAHAVLGVR